jgi:hypothetical protein
VFCSHVGCCPVQGLLLQAHESHSLAAVSCSVVALAGIGHQRARGLYRVVGAHVLLFDPSPGTLSLWLCCSSLHCVCFFVEQRCACSGCLEHNMPRLLGSFHCCLSCVDCVAYLWLLLFAHGNESHCCGLPAALCCWHVAHLACWRLPAAEHAAGARLSSGSIVTCVCAGVRQPHCCHPVYCRLLGLPCITLDIRLVAVLFLGSTSAASAAGFVRSRPSLAACTAGVLHITCGTLLPCVAPVCVLLC